MQQIYLDNHASTPIDPLVLRVLTESYEKFRGNPHAEHNLYGRKANQAIETASETLIEAFKNHIEYGSIYFTSGATEANNLALIGTIESHRELGNDKNRIIISSIEHKSVQAVAKMLARKYEMELIEAPVAADGRLDLKFLKSQINKQTAIVSIQATNSEIGVEQDITAINDMCKNHGVVFHSDMTQSAYMEIEKGENELDLISISGHKRYAPQGIGALIVNSFGLGGLQPVMFGGDQQNGIRPGTVPTALILAFAKAIEIGESKKVTEIKKIKKMRDNFIKQLRDYNVDFKINGSMDFRHPGNINITFAKMDALDLIVRTENEIAISTSSACTSAESAPSHVLKAIGLSDEEIRRTIRIGIGRFNTEKDIKAASDIIARAAKQ